MKVLLVGGTGTISSGVTPEILARGMELWLMNRGNRTDRTPAGANQLIAD